MVDLSSTGSNLKRRERSLGCIGLLGLDLDSGGGLVGLRGGGAASGGVGVIGSIAFVGSAEETAGTTDCTCEARELAITQKSTEVVLNELC